MTATADGGALLVNVHVGGIQRSTDGGATWAPTIAVDDDVHQVLAHPTRPEIVVAAASVGLCRSTDGGATWESATDGMEMSYARGVAIVGDDVARHACPTARGPSGRPSTARPVDGGPVEKVAGGLPEYLSGNIDTRCLASDGTKVALVDGDGDVWRRPTGATGSCASPTASPGSPASRSPEPEMTPHYAVRFVPARAVGDRMSQTAGIGVVDGRVVVPRTFAWSGEPQGDRMRWFADGLRAGHARPGVHRGRAAPGPEVAVVLHFVDPRRGAAVPAQERAHVRGRARRARRRRPPTCCAPATRCSCAGSPTCA